MNIGVHVSFWVRVFSRYMPRSGFAGSYCSSIFSFLRKLHTVRHSGCTNLHSHQWHGRIPFSPHPLQHLLFIVFLMMAILTSVRWYLLVVLISIFLTISHLNTSHVSVGHLYVFFEKCLFRSSPIFWLGCLSLVFLFFVFWYWAVWAVCIFWKLIPCWSHHLQIFSPILWVIFSFCLWFSLLCKSF